METIRSLWNRYKEPLLYVVFGGFTTLINIVVYFVCRSLLQIDVVPADVIAWFLSVVFAYVTNKLYVFESKGWRMQLVLREAAEFFAARIFSLGVDVLFLYVTVQLLSWWEMPMKIAANVIVIIINYVFSKLFIFKKETSAKGERRKS